MVFMSVCLCVCVQMDEAAQPERVNVPTNLVLLGKDDRLDPNDIVMVRRHQPHHPLQATIATTTT